MPGVMDDHAFVESEWTMELTGMNKSSEYAGPTEDPDSDVDIASKLDASTLKIDHAIVSTEYNYRLLTIASTENYQRFVDPTFALLSIARSPKLCCGHDAETRPTSVQNLPLRFQTLDSVFGTWDRLSDHEEDSDSSNYNELIPTSYILDDHEKFNSVLCLCLDGYVIVEPDGCLECAAKLAKEFDSSRHMRILRRPAMLSERRALVRR
jgi:hypothetical protein